MRCLNNLVLLLQATNRFEEAEPLAWRILEIFTAYGKAKGHEYPHMQAALSNYFCLLQEMGLSEDQARAKIHAKLRGDMQ